MHPKAVPLLWSFWPFVWWLECAQQAFFCKSWFPDILVKRQGFLFEDQRFIHNFTTPHFLGFNMIQEGFWSSWNSKAPGENCCMDLVVSSIVVGGSGCPCLSLVLSVWNIPPRPLRYATYLSFSFTKIELYQSICLLPIFAIMWPAFGRLPFTGGENCWLSGIMSVCGVWKSG
jgi:hypothetical protein